MLTPAALLHFAANTARVFVQPHEAKEACLCEHEKQSIYDLRGGGAHQFTKSLAPKSMLIPAAIEYGPAPFGLSRSAAG